MSRSPAGAAGVVTLGGTQGVQMGGPAVSFGSWVRRRRLALDLTRDALARRVGCSVSAVKKIERDERRPSRTMATRFADALGIPPEQRDRFIGAALGELAADRLPDGSAAAGAAPPWLSQPPGAATRRVVGRNRELHRMRAHLDAARNGHGRTVFVTGEAGQGKTALLTAFADRAQEAVPDLVVARGAGTALGGHSDPDLLIRDVFRMLLADPLAPLQADLLTPAQAQRLWEFAPAVARTIDQVGAHLLGTVIPTGTLWERLGGGTIPTATSPPSRDHLVDEVTDVLRVLAESAPLLVLFDDLHWADAASADLVFHLARRLTDSRILVVCAFRDSEVTGNLRPASALVRKTVLEVRGRLDDPHIDLEQTDQGAARELCSALLELEAPGLDPAVHERIYATTRGHPLFVHELIRDLITRGELTQRTDATWNLSTDLDWDRLPARVAAVIEQRLDRLEPDERALLDAAAVEGEHFIAEVAAAVAGVDEHTAQKLLAAQLDRIHHLVRDASATRVAGRTLTRYRFGHELFQRFVYTRLPPGPRRAAHQRLARVLEELHRGNLEPLIPQLAYHYAEGGDGVRAVPYLIKAGDRARLAHAHNEAVAGYHLAVEFLREQDDEALLASTLMKLGVTHQTSFDHQRAQLAFDEAFTLWPVVEQAGTAQAVTGGATLRVLSPEPKSLDPAQGGDTLGSLSNCLFSGLVRYDKDANVVPDVAQRWTISADGRRYVFHLRDDVVWSDGQPLTAHDFVFTYQRVLDDTSWDPMPRDLLAPVAEVTSGRQRRNQPGFSALDERTLAIELAEPTSFFLYNLISDTLMPVPRHVVEHHGEAWWKPGVIVSNGPFVLATWQPGASLTLERNARYHGSPVGNVHRVTVQFYEAWTAEQEDRYLSDEVDVIGLSFNAPQNYTDRLSRKLPAELRTDERTHTLAYGISTDAQSPLGDRRLRQAMAMAVDKRAAVRRWRFGPAVPAQGGFVPPDLPGHLSSAALPHDPDRAAQLIREVLTGSQPPELTIVVFRPFRPVAEQVADDWRAVGLTVRLRTAMTLVDHDQMMATMPGPKVGLIAWLADYPDPDSFLRIGVKTWLPEWRHDRYQALIDNATRITDPERRLATYRQAEQVLAAEGVLVPLAYLGNRLMIKPWVTSYPSVPFSGKFRFWQDVVIDTARQPSEGS